MLTQEAPSDKFSLLVIEDTFCISTTKTALPNTLK